MENKTLVKIYSDSIFYIDLLVVIHWFILQVIVSLLLVSFSITRKSELRKLNGDLDQLSAL